MRQSIYVPTEQKFGVQYFTRMKSSQAFFKRPFSKGRARDVRLHDDVFDDLAFDVRKPEIPAGVAIGELLVIHAEQVQSGRMQIVHMHRTLHNLESEIVGSPVDRSGFHAAAR